MSEDPTGTAGPRPPSWAPPPPARHYEPHRGTLVLVLGIVGLLVCGPLGIGAWVMANRDLATMAAGRMDPSGKGMTEVGRILGIVATILLTLVSLYIIVVVGLGALWYFVYGLKKAAP